MSVGAGKALILAALLALWRGIQHCARLPNTDREHGLLPGLGALSAGATAVPGLSPLQAVLLAAAAMALVVTPLLQAALTTMVLLRLVRRLQHQSDHDKLTGLLSRRPTERRRLTEPLRQQRGAAPAGNGARPAPPRDGGEPVTISIRVAVMRAPAEPIQALQRRLDQALYRAKAAGRNCIEHAAAAAVTRLCANAACATRLARLRCRPP